MRNMATLRVELIPILSDNYAYFIHESIGNVSAIIDPGESKIILSYLKEKNISLDYILCTHHHSDHTAGCLAIKQQTHCQIYGPHNEASRIPGIDHPLKEGNSISIGKATANIINVPGHTSGHIAYWFETENILFSGDTLFSLGCGRVFEGTNRQMLQSLLRLRSLPPQTLIYCGHEYTLNNAKFALNIDPNNQVLIKRAAEVDQLRIANKPTIPSLMENESFCNPFLRCDRDDLKQTLHMSDKDPLSIFTEIRALKDQFSTS